MLVRGLLVLSLALPRALAQSPSADDQYHFLVALEEKGLHEQLVREARAFLRDHGAHEKAALARYRLAGALYELERIDEARTEYAALASVPGFELAGEVDLRLGQCELARDDLAAASAAFERVRARGQTYLHTPATFLLGEASFRRKDYQAAEQHYTHVAGAADAKELAREAERALAWCAFQTKRWDEARQRAQRFVDRRPDDAFVDELRWLAGESCLEAGRPADAATWFARVGEGQYRPDALRGAAFAAAEQEQHARAAELFGELVAKHPDSRWSAEARLHRGIELLRAGEAEAALAALERADAGAEQGYWRARAQAALGRHDQALATLDRALAASPDEELAGRIHVARGDALSALGRAEEAARAWESGGSDYALQAAAVAELAAGRAREALRLAEGLLARELDADEKREAELVCAEAHFALEDYAAAEASFGRVLLAEKDPARLARACSRLAWCRYLAGDHAEAAKRFAAVAQRFPDAAEAEEARFLEARALESAGDSARAAESLARYLAKHADGAHASEAMLRLARLEGPAGRARLEALIARSPEPEIAIPARHELAERLSEEGLYAEAEPHYRAVIDAGEASGLLPQATYGLAWARHSQGAPEEAARLVRGLLARKGLDDTLVLSSLELLVWAERGAKNADGARAAYDALAARSQDDARVLAAAKVAAMALAEAGRKEDASRIYDKLASRTGDAGVRAAAALERAWLDLDAGEVAAAEAKARAALEALPAEASVRECLFFVGEAWYERGEDEKAASCYALAQESTSSDVASRALYKAGFASLRREDADGAARAFAALVERYPKSELCGEALYLCGEAEARAGRHEAAIAPLARVRKEFPAHAVWEKAMLRLGESLVHLERWREAADVCAALLRKAPDGEGAVRAELAHARALAGMGERRGARAALAHVIEKDRGQLSAQARLVLGSLAEEENDLETALSEYLKVALLYAHEEEVAEALFRAGVVLEKQDQKEQALARFREAAEHEDTEFGRSARERLAGG